MAALAAVAAFASGCRDESSPDKPPVVEPPSNCPAVPPAPLRLLTRHEYDNTVRDLLGDVTKPARDFPREPLAHGLDNDATLLQVGPDNVTRYFEAAESLAQQAVQAGAGPVMPKCEGKAPAVCGRDFLQALAPRFFRRPLVPAEWDVLVGIFDTTLAQDGFAVAVERSVQSLLQSPQFLYRDELGSPAADASQNSRLSPHQLAAKLSYFVRASTPDPTLYASAAAGKLQTTADVREAATKLLAQPGGLDGLARFLTLWLYLDGVEITEKDSGVYPQFDRKLALAWRRSLELYVGDVLSTKPTLKTLLTSRVLFANDAMSMYDGRGGESKADFVRLETAAGRAGGILAQPGFLAFKSLHNGSSPIRRGIFVLDKLMCAPPPSPPADQPIVPPAPSMTKTTRQRFDVHREDQTCANCHKLIDPIGFVFENYDGMGMWRSQENGQPIDASGGIIDADDAALIGPVNGVDELVAKLVQSRQVHDCVAREVYRFAAGRPLTDADACWFESISKKFFESGGDFKELMLAIATSPSFAQHAPLSEAP